MLFKVSSKNYEKVNFTKLFFFLGNSPLIELNQLAIADRHPSSDSGKTCSILRRDFNKTKFDLHSSLFFS